MEQNDLVCTFFNHGSKTINRFCLSRSCFNTSRKVCEDCLTDKHFDHQADCFKVYNIIEIINNDIWKLEQFLQNLPANTLSEELLLKFQTLQNELENAVNMLNKFDSLQNVLRSVQIAVRCYNDQIQEELKYFMYEESISNEQYTPIRQSHFEILNKSYEKENEGFLTSNFISQGDNLNDAKRWEQALLCYDQALRMTSNADQMMYIQKKKYDMLLDHYQLDEAGEILAKISDIPTLSPHQFITCQLILRALQMHKNKPQFNITWDVMNRIFKHIDNIKLCQAVILIKFRQIYEAYDLVREIDRSDPAFSILILVQGKIILILVICLIKMGRLKDALNPIIKACQDDPDNQEFIYWKKLLLFISCSEYKSIEEFQQPQLKSVAFIAKSISLNFKQGITLARCENIKGALETIDLALKINPNQELALYIKGMFLIHCGEKNEAIQIFKKLNIDISDDYQKVIRSTILRLQGKTWESFEAFVHVEKFLINFLAYDNYQKLIRIEKWSLFYLQDNRDKLQLAFDTLEVLKPFDPNNSQLATLKAVTLAQLNKLDLAEKEIDYAIEILEASPFKKDTFYLLYVKGCILAQNKKYEQAKKCFDETIKQCQDFHRVHACKALMLIRLNLYKLAIDELKIPSVENLGNASIKYNLGIAYYNNYQYKEAKKLFTELKSYKNSNLYLVITLIQSAEYNDAKSILQTYPFEAEQNQKIKLLEALSLIGSEKYSDALVFIDDLIQQFGGDWQIYLCKSFALYCLSQFDESFNALELVLQQQGDKTLFIVYFLASLIVIQLEKYDDALIYLEVIQPKLHNNDGCPNQNIKELMNDEILPKLQQDQKAQIKQSIENNFKLIRAFLLTKVVQAMETMEVSDEDIQLKKSQIQWWLLTVDFNIFMQDLWWLFNYDQKTQKLTKGQ